MSSFSKPMSAITICLIGATLLGTHGASAATSTDDLSVQVSESPSPVNAGNDANFQVQVTNVSDATIYTVSVQLGVSVTDTQENAVLIPPLSLTCQGAAGSTDCLIGSLAPGQTAGIPVVVGTHYDEAGETLQFSSSAFSSGGANSLPAVSEIPIGTAGSPGYQLAASDGGVFAFGPQFNGSLGSLTLAAPISGMSASPDGLGYWLSARDGGVFAFGDAIFAGSAVGFTHGPVIGITSNPSIQGYALATASGQIWQFAPSVAPALVYSAPLPLNSPIVGISSTQGGYVLAASDGNVFTYNTDFFGSIGSQHLNAPIVGVASDPATGGYWLVAADGGVFSFNAPFAGSTGSLKLNQPIVGMTIGATPGNTIQSSSTR